MSENALHRPQDGRVVGLNRQTEILRLLYRFGWLRTWDLACATGKVAPKAAPKSGPSLQPPDCSRADIRRTQRHLASLKERRLILSTQAPNGSWIYALSEKGARALQGLGLEASTGKDLLRNYHAAFFLHRNIANELAIGALQQGFKVSTEREIAQARWFGGAEGILGKKPDVVLRAGNEVWFVEVERSHKNRTDYNHLLKFLLQCWRNVRVGEAVGIAAGYQLRQVVFVCTGGFSKKVSQDLLANGWSPEELKVRIRFETSLYSFRTISFY